jgi:tetratricopeptide (TPR) repeat protein
MKAADEVTPLKTLRSPLRPLTLAIAASLVAAFAAPVLAQQDYGTTGDSARAQRAKRLKELGKGEEQAKKQDAQPALFPEATRPSPEAKAKGKGLKMLQDLQKAFEQQDNAGVIAKAEQIGAGDGNAYEKAFAYQLAGNAAADLGDEAKSAEYFKKALDANGLDNDSHYQVMYNLAVVQYGQDQFPAALATLDRFLAETRSDKPEYQSLRAGILANLGRSDDAAKIYGELLAKHPQDMKIRMNAVAAYQQADQFDKANALLADAQKQGLLTEANQYRALYIGYINDDKNKEALAVIEDGIAKGVIKLDPELAKDFAVLAQKAYYNGSDADAVALYKRAASISADGEASLNLAKILNDQGKKAEAKAAAQAALDKGVKKPEDARRILGK